MLNDFVIDVVIIFNFIYSFFKLKLRFIIALSNIHKTRRFKDSTYTRMFLKWSYS